MRIFSTLPITVTHRYSRHVGSLVAVLLFGFAVASQGYAQTAPSIEPSSATESPAAKADVTTVANDVKVLTGEEVSVLISGKKMYFDWKPQNTSTLRGRYDFAKDGTFWLHNAGANSRNGKWWIEGDNLCIESYMFKDKRCSQFFLKREVYFRGGTPVMI